MNIAAAIKRVLGTLSGRSTPQPVPAPVRSVVESDRLVVPGAKELMALIELDVRRIHGYSADEYGEDIPDIFIDQHLAKMTYLLNVVTEFGEETIKALLRSSREPDFSITHMLSKYNHIGEDGILKKSLFYPACRGYRVDSYELDVALDRLVIVDATFLTSRSDWDEATLKHANAVLRVIIHFIRYKGYPSYDTSVFLREEPEMADEVIDYIERRGIGQKGFNLEVFNMMRQNAAPVLNDGLL